MDRDGAWFVFGDKDVPERLEKVWADKGYAGPKAAAAAAQAQVSLEIIRNPDPHHFCITHHRWVVERTNAWISGARRLARDHERTIASSKSLIYLRLSVLYTHWIQRGSISPSC